MLLPISFYSCSTSDEAEEWTIPMPAIVEEMKQPDYSQEILESVPNTPTNNPDTVIKTILGESVSLKIQGKHTSLDIRQMFSISSPVQSYLLTKGRWPQKHQWGEAWLEVTQNQVFRIIKNEGGLASSETLTILNHYTLTIWESRQETETTSYNCITTRQTNQILLMEAEEATFSFNQESGELWQLIPKRRKIGKLQKKET